MNEAKKIVDELSSAESDRPVSLPSLEEATKADEEATRNVRELLSAGFGRQVSSPSAEEIAKAHEGLKATFPSYGDLLKRAAFLQSKNEQLRHELELLNREFNSLKLSLAWMKLVPSEIFDSVIELVQRNNSPLHVALDRFAKENRTKEARKAGRIKRTDAAKQIVKECWEAWIQETEVKRNKADFARRMRRKNLGISCSEDVIRRWMREWEREKNL